MFCHKINCQSRDSSTYLASTYKQKLIAGGFVGNKANFAFTTSTGHTVTTGPPGMFYDP